MNASIFFHKDVEFLINYYRVGANQDDWTFHLSEISRAGHTRERALAARHALWRDAWRAATPVEKLQVSPEISAKARGTLPSGPASTPPKTVH